MNKINPKFLSGQMATDQELDDILVDKVAELFEVIVTGERVLSSTDISNGYFDVNYPVIPFTMKLHSGRMRIHETLDFTISPTDEGSRITFIGPSASGGVEELTEGTQLVYKFKYSSGEIMALYKLHYKEIDATDIANNYVDLPHLAKVKGIDSHCGRLGMFETIDYDTSVVNGVTRITFKGDFLPTGSTPLSVGNVVVFNYPI